MAVKSATAMNAAEKAASKKKAKPSTETVAPRMDMAPSGAVNPGIDAIAGADRTRNEPYPISDAAETSDQVKVTKAPKPKPPKTVAIRLPRYISQDYPEAAIMHIHFGKDINGHQLSENKSPFPPGTDMTKWWGMLRDGMSLAEFFTVDGGSLRPYILKIWERQRYLTITKTTGEVPAEGQGEMRMSGTNPDDDAAHEPETEENETENGDEEGEQKETTFPPTRRAEESPPAA